MEGKRCAPYHQSLIATTSYRISSCHIISHYITSFQFTCMVINSPNTIPYHIILYHITSNHTILHHLTSHHITSQHVTSHHIISYHNTSPNILSHHITSPAWSLIGTETARQQPLCRVYVVHSSMGREVVDA